MKHIIKQDELELRQDFLIYGKEYHLWRDKKYIGKAIYTDDLNIGDSFLKKIINDTNEECFEVHIPDEWQFV
jgi:hypothetical protein